MKYYIWLYLVNSFFDPSSVLHITLKDGYFIFEMVYISGIPVDHPVHREPLLYQEVGKMGADEALNAGYKTLFHLTFSIISIAFSASPINCLTVSRVYLWSAILVRNWGGMVMM